MPILEIVLSRPLAMPLTTFHWAVSKSSTPGTRPSATSCLERLEHQVRVDRARAVADQRREVVDLARLAGLEHEAGLQARALAHEVVVHAGDGQQRRDRGALGADRAVGEDQDVDAVGERLVGLGADALERARHPVRALGDRPRDVDRVRLEDRAVDVAQLLELAVEQDRRLHRRAGARARASRRAGCARSRRRCRRSSRSPRGSGRSAGS